VAIRTAKGNAEKKKKADAMALNGSKGKAAKGKIVTEEPVEEDPFDDSSNRKRTLTITLMARLAAGHPATPRARYIRDSDDSDEAEEIILRRRLFRKEAAIGDFWKSTKLIETVKIVKQRLEADKVGKILVFCEFLVVLDILEIGL